MSAAAGWLIPLQAAAAERLSRLRLSAESRAGLARGWLAPADVDILGSYNTSNVGDRSFAVCLERATEEAGLRARLQNYSAYHRARHSRNLVIGGGGILGPQNAGLRRCAEDRQSKPGAVAVLGVSGALATEDVDPALRALLQRATFVSVRDRKTQASLQRMLEREIELQPDIAFSLLDWFPALASGATPEQKTIGLSLSPVLASRQGRTFLANQRASPWFAERIPDVAAVYSSVAPAYVSLLRTSVARFVRAGYRVRAIPFAAEDHTFGQAVLAGCDVEFVPFDSDPLRVFESVTRCERFIATRFHAHVFALLARVPLFTLPYSEKCNLLLTELFETDHGMGPVRWVKDARSCEEYLSNPEKALQLDESGWRGLRARAVDVVRRGFSSLSG